MRVTRSRSSAIGAMSVALLAITAAAAAAQGTLTGTVTATAGGTPLQEARVGRQLPEQLDVRQVRRNQHDIERSLADHLVGDVDVGAARVACFRRGHTSSLRRAVPWRKRGRHA